MTRALLAAVAGCLALGVAGCALPTAEHPTVPSSAKLPVLAGADADPVSRGYAVRSPGPLDQPLLRADVLVVGDRPLPASLRTRLQALDEVRAAVPLSVASVPVAGRTVTVGAVDPRSYRRFTPERSAESGPVWDRVAAGDLALGQDLATAMRQPLGGDLVLGNQQGAMRIRVGAFASLSPGLDAVVNKRRGAQLGMLADNAILVSGRSFEPVELAGLVEEAAPRGFDAYPLQESASGEQTAFLTGGSVGQAVGSFRYRYSADGTVEPDPTWVQASIRTEAVPILGQVTCHRVMLPQLRAALQEVVDAGLADRIDAGDFGGCYVPRFIAHDPARGLSLHTWGIAVDLNVAGNLRGTVGEIDREVVAIFKKWGFAWGGDWQYTDPMHFELAALVQPR